MSVMIVTSLGDIVIDLHTDECPLTCKNFLKLCKIKYYNGCVFHTIQKDFTAQTGDPTGTGNGGDSIYKFLYGDQARFFGDEFRLDLKHLRTGTVSMASGGESLNASQFYFTLRDDLEYLDGKHTVFGKVAEGLETLTRINEAYVDEKGRPYKNIRIKHTYILEDPFDDPPQLVDHIPDASPEGKPKEEVDDQVRLEDDWVPMDEKIGTTELEEIIRAKEAHSSAVVLESIGDIPDAEMKPPDNVLFVCKLNSVTEDEDLHTIFSRFGTVIAADIIRDFKTGDSLCYAFIEFETNESCEQAYFKMDNALIDDRRIHVDFSQSVSKLWSQYRRKGNKAGQGCFKCGALDHIAKDCTGEPAAKQLPPKYTLKVDNAQHGGKKNSRYDMVFDEDTPTSPQQEKKREDIEHNGEKQKPREENLESMRPPRHRQSDRGRGHREDEWGRDRKTSRPRRDEYLDEREKLEGETYVERRDKDKRDERDNGNDRKKYGDRKVHADDDRDDRRRDDRKNYGDQRVHADGDRVDRRKDDRDYKKRDADNYRRDQKDEPSYKKRSLDDGYKKEERDHTRRKGDDDRDRRHQSDRR